MALGVNRHRDRNTDYNFPRRDSGHLNSNSWTWAFHQQLYRAENHAEICTTFNQLPVYRIHALGSSAIDVGHDAEHRAYRNGLYGDAKRTHRYHCRSFPCRSNSPPHQVHYLLEYGPDNRKSNGPGPGNSKKSDTKHLLSVTPTSRSQLTIDMAVSVLA